MDYIESICFLVKGNPSWLARRLSFFFFSLNISWWRSKRESFLGTHVQGLERWNCLRFPAGFFFFLRSERLFFIECVQFALPISHVEHLIVSATLQERRFSVGWWEMARIRCRTGRKGWRTEGSRRKGDRAERNQSSPPWFMVCFHIKHVRCTRTTPAVYWEIPSCLKMKKCAIFSLPVFRESLFCCREGNTIMDQ